MSGPPDPNVDTATPADLAERTTTLRDILHRANQAYHVLDDPIMSDAEYDRLFRELQTIEAEHPELRSPDSPTHRVGAEPASKLNKHRHRVPMLSLGNAFDDAELTAWQTRIAKIDPAVLTAGYQLELKIDGAAVNLTYEAGVLTVGATRGNGVIGEDVTANLRTIRDIPLRLLDTDWPESMEVRGEVYFTLDTFARINEQREAAGEPPFANPRNSAAGSLRQLDSTITRARQLRFFAFHVSPTGSSLSFDTQHEVLGALQRWGFQVAPHHRRVDLLEEAHGAIAELESLIPSLPFEADGVVVKIDQLSLHPVLGVVGGREPRWAIARKFAPEVAVTKLEAIRVNVGRTGALNPYAALTPVEVTGVTVSNATLHNFDLIAAKDIREGDFVEVTRAGEVIPQVLGPVREQRPEGTKPYQIPSKCPVCATPTVQPAGEVMYYCPNVACAGRTLECIIHFASRSAMDIRGLGVQRVVQLRDAGLVRNVADLYTLTAEQLLGLEGFAEKAATQLVQAIEDSKRQPLAVLLFALGIRHVGANAAKLLAHAFGCMDALMSAPAEEIATIDGVGPIMAAAVEEFFHTATNQEMIERLRQYGLTLEDERTDSEGVLDGQTFVITGTLPTLSRSDATSLIEASGGKVTSSVSKKTTAVVVGESPGSKAERARALGVPTIDESELLRRIG